MSGVIEDPPSRTAGSLLSGILGDLQRLVQQQLLLTRREVEIELSQRATAGFVFGFGAALLMLAGIECCLAVSHFLHWSTSPPGIDPATLPLWGCHAAVGTTVAIGGGILLFLGRTMFNRKKRNLSDPRLGLLQEPLK